MEKDKRPRKPAKPARRSKKATGGKTSQRPPRAAVVRVPRARPPVAASGTEVPARHRPAVDRLLRLLRTAVGALLDVADAAAGAITKGQDGQGTKRATRRSAGSA